MGRARELAEVATAYVGGGLHFRNRIINGDMRVDQRNNGASVSIPGSTNRFVVDRFNGDNSTSSGQVYSLQRVTDAPSGFSNSLLATVTTAGAAGTGNYQYIRQAIEGFNFADLMFGTANAQTFTLSFWVKSSLTGTHAGYLGAALNNRFRVFTYTINAANTWEYKTVTIPGDTAGTWDSGNGVGLQVAWSLACGSNFQGSPGAWGSTTLLGATGQVQLLQTSGATFYITGVQLEAGSVATPFERRPYGTELALCQRYFQRTDAILTSAANGTTTIGTLQFATAMRASPTTALTASLKITDGFFSDHAQSSSNIAIQGGGTRVSASGAQIAYSNFTGLTQARPYMSVVNETGFITLSAEL